MSDYYALTNEEIETLSDTKKIMYKGDLEGFLSYLTNVFGVYLSLDKNSQVNASFYQTKTYMLTNLLMEIQRQLL